VTNRQTDRQTDRPRHSLFSNRPLSLAIAAMWPNDIDNSDDDDNDDDDNNNNKKYVLWNMVSAP